MVLVVTKWCCGAEVFIPNRFIPNQSDPVPDAILAANQERVTAQPNPANNQGLGIRGKGRVIWLFERGCGGMKVGSEASNSIGAIIAIQ